MKGNSRLPVSSATEVGRKPSRRLASWEKMGNDFAHVVLEVLVETPKRRQPGRRGLPKLGLEAEPREPSASGYHRGLETRKSDQREDQGIDP